jgi:hypothetical protein
MRPIRSMIDALFVLGLIPVVTAIAFAQPGDITLASTSDVGIKGKGDSFFDEPKGGGQWGGEGYDNM